MSEHQRAILPYEEFLDEIHPATIAEMKEVESEVADDYSRLGYATYWLRENQDNPLADPNHRLYYEQEAERIKAKLERPYGEA